MQNKLDKKHIEKIGNIEEIQINSPEGVQT